MTTTNLQRRWWRIKRLWCLVTHHIWRFEKEFGSCRRCHSVVPGRELKWINGRIARFKADIGSKP